MAGAPPNVTAAVMLRRSRQQGDPATRPLTVLMAEGLGGRMLRDPQARVGLGIVAALAIFAAVGPALSGWDPDLSDFSVARDRFGAPPGPSAAAALPAISAIGGALVSGSPVPGGAVSAPRLGGQRSRYLVRPGVVDYRRGEVPMAAICPASRAWCGRF